MLATINLVRIIAVKSRNIVYSSGNYTTFGWWSSWEKCVAGIADGAAAGGLAGALVGSLAPVIGTSPGASVPLVPYHYTSHLFLTNAPL